MTFKEQIALDNKNIFLNFEEFGENHLINGNEMLCIVDNNELIDREKKYRNRNGVYADGIYYKELLIYVRAEDFGLLPAIGRILYFDKKSYLISDAIDEDGIYSLSLEANKT